MKMKMKMLRFSQESIESQFLFLSLSVYSRKEAKTKKGFTNFFLSLSLCQKETKTKEREKERERERERLLREKREERRETEGISLSFVSFFLKDDV